MTPTRTSTRLWAALTLVAIIAAIAWTHASVLSAGLRSDDYYVIRPWTVAQIRHVLTGSWDPLGFQDPYHRPLTALYQSLWYPLFGYDARALHAVSLIELALVAAGLAAFVGRELRRPAAGLLAAVVLIVHPMLPDSTSAWIFNQMSLLADLMVVGALLAWQRARHGSARAWWLVWALATASVYIKEDGAMLVPALLTLQWWRARRLGDVPAPSARLVLSGAALLGVLLSVRLAVYPTAAIWPPALSSAGYYLRNVLSGPFHVLVQLPGDSLAATLASIGLVCALLAAAVLAWRQQLRTPAATLLGSGAIAMTWLGAPLLFISGPTRAHLLTLSAAIIITAALVVVYDACTTRPARRLVAAAALLTILFLSLAAQDMNLRYAPCSDDSLHEDALIVDFEAVPLDVRAWLRAKAGTCATDSYQPLPARLNVTRPQL